MKTFKTEIIETNRWDVSKTPWSRRDFKRWLDTSLGEIDKIGSSWKCKIIKKSYSPETDGILVNVEVKFVSVDNSLETFSFKKSVYAKIEKVLKKWFEKGFYQSDIIVYNDGFKIEAFMAVKNENI